MRELPGSPLAGAQMKRAHQRHLGIICELARSPPGGSVEQVEVVHPESMHESPNSGSAPALLSSIDFSGPSLPRCAALLSEKLLSLRVAEVVKLGQGSCYAGCLHGVRADMTMRIILRPMGRSSANVPTDVQLVQALLIKFAKGHSRNGSRVHHPTAVFHLAHVKPRSQRPSG